MLDKIEILREYNTKMKTIVSEGFSVNVGEFVKFSNKMVQYLIDELSVVESEAESVKTGSNNLDKLILFYKIDAEFNKVTAGETLRRGLNLVISEGYSFDGRIFRKGDSVKSRK